METRVPIQQLSVSLDGHDHAGFHVVVTQEAPDFCLDAFPGAVREFPSSLRSKRVCSLRRLEIVSTIWRCGTGAQNSSATCSAVNRFFAAYSQSSGRSIVTRISLLSIYASSLGSISVD